MSGVAKDSEVCAEDQQKINEFARCNVRCTDIKADIEVKKREIENIQYAEDEMMIALDADEKVPYQFEDLFIMKTQDEATESFASDAATKTEQLARLTEQAEGFEATMAGLRTQLYAKFGTNIRLEQSDDES